MGDFLSFRKMVTPVIIEIIFIVGTIVCLIVGAGMMVYGGSQYQMGMQGYFWKGLILFFLGPLGVRIYCEILIVFFRINETLTEIKHVLEERKQA